MLRVRFVGVTLAALTVIALVGLTAAYIGNAATLGARLNETWGLAWVGCPVVGGLLVARRPGQPIGWLLIFVGACTAVSFGSAAYVDAVNPHAGAGGATLVAASLLHPMITGSFAATIGVVLVFPTGRAVGRITRIGRRLVLAALVLCVVGYVFSRRVQLTEGVWSANPLHPGWAGPLPDDLVRVGALLFIAAGAAALVSIIVRFRQSTGTERQQLRWFLRAAVVIPVLFVPGAALESVSSTLSNLLILLALVGGLNAIAIAIGFGVLRYRLYDLDRLVSRTVSYAVVTGLIVGVYVGAIAIANAFSGLLGFSSSLAVAASTLAAAAAFQPLRRRIQRLVDRRFDRAGYDARRTVDAFSARLRDEVDVDAVRAELLTMVEQTMAPASLSLAVLR